MTTTPHNPTASVSQAITDIATKKTLRSVTTKNRDIKIGDVILVVETEKVMTRKRPTFSASCDLPGLGGNLDSSQKRLHGWRGTTNDIARYACGLWIVADVTGDEYGYENTLTVQKLKASAEERVSQQYSRVYNEIDAEAVGYYVDEVAWDRVNKSLQTERGAK